MNARNAGTYIGRLVSNPKFLSRKEDGKEFQARFTLAVQRAYKNRDGSYDYDYLPIRLSGDEKRLKIAHKIKLKDVLIVSGDTRTDKYTRNGQTVFEVFINAESVSWAPRSYEESAKSEDGGTSKNNTTEQTSPSYSNTSVSSTDFEYDLPFN